MTSDIREPEELVNVKAVRSFTKECSSKDGDFIYLIREESTRGRTWRYIMVKRNALTKICEFSYSINQGLNHYGETLYAGLGEYPPDIITEKIYEEYA